MNKVYTVLGLLLSLALIAAVVNAYDVIGQKDFSIVLYDKENEVESHIYNNKYYVQEVFDGTSRVDVYDSKCGTGYQIIETTKDNILVSMGYGCEANDRTYKIDLNSI